MSKTKRQHTRATAAAGVMIIKHRRGWSHTYKPKHGKYNRIDILVCVCLVESHDKLTQALRSVQEGQPRAGTIAGI